MPLIYKLQHDSLDELIRQAGGGSSGSTLFIPNLQRPFVWTPAQVTLLIDSLIRGWPFGTLLLWSISEEQHRVIPKRGFWSIEDRTGEGTGLAVPLQNPPAPRGGFRMVLDGQQRLQSLLLALTGDASGFKLPDRAWFEALDVARPRGRRANHWTAGQLCLDLDAFARAAGSGDDVRLYDYSELLQWVVCDPQYGRSKGKRPANYKEPLDEAGKHPGRFIRFSRLWALADVKGTPPGSTPES